MKKDNWEERERIFKNISLGFCLLYYLVTALNVYIAIVQLLNGHFFYFFYYISILVLEKMILLMILRRLEFQQATKLVMTDIFFMGFIYLMKRKEIEDICTFFIAKLYLSVIPTVYLQMWFYFGFELIENDYLQFGWFRPALMNFTIIGNICILAYGISLQTLSLENQRGEMISSIHKLKLLSLLMNPFGYQLSLYCLFTIQIQQDDQFGICVVFYGLAYQIIIELSKKFLGFSLNISEYGLLSLIRRTGALKALRVEKGLDIPEYLKNALNFSGLVDLLIHVAISIFLSEVSFLSDQSSEEYVSFSHKFLQFQNFTIYLMIILYFILKLMFTAYVSRSIHIFHHPDQTLDELTRYILKHPDLWFLAVFQTKQASQDIEMEQFRLSQDLLQFVDSDELSANVNLHLSEGLLRTQYISNNFSLKLLSRFLLVQRYKGFFEINQVLTISKISFFVDTKKLNLSDQGVVTFLSQTNVFPIGVKMHLSPMLKSDILFNRFFEYGLISDDILMNLDCSKQIQRQMKQVNVLIHQMIAFNMILTPFLSQQYISSLLLNLQESSSQTNTIKQTFMSSSLTHTVRLF